MFYNLIKIIFSPIVKFLWLGRINGMENIPRKGSFILCANHQSYIDFFLLGSVMERKVYFLAGEVFFRSKLWRPLVKWTGQIQVDRNSKDKSKVYSAVDKLFKKDNTLCIFPEGTRSRSGNLQHGYNGATKFAYKYKIPIIPIGIVGAFLAWPPQNKMPKIKRVDINIGELIYINTNNFDMETQSLMKKIAKLSNLDYNYE